MYIEENAPHDLLVNGRFVEQLALRQLVHHVLLFIIVRSQNAVQRSARYDVFASFGLCNDGIDIDDRLVVTRCLQERSVLVETDLKSKAKFTNRSLGIQDFSSRDSPLSCNTSASDLAGPDRRRT